MHSGFFYLPITEIFKRSMESLQITNFKIISILVYAKDLCP